MIKYRVAYKVEHKISCSIENAKKLVIAVHVKCLESNLSIGRYIFQRGGVHLDPDNHREQTAVDGVTNRFDTLEEAQNWVATIRANIEGQHSVYGKMMEAEPSKSGAVKVYVVE